MDAFPAFFPLKGRRIVVAGTGEAAEAKARLFEGSPAELVRLDGFDAVTAGPYAGALMAFIAGDDAFTQAAVRAARTARVLINVVDRPALSDFTTPAVIDRGAVVAAVGTAGAAPMLATLLRNDIEARLPESAGKLAALLRSRQDAVRAALPDLTARRAFLREVLNGPVAAAALAGDMDRADQLLMTALAEPGGPRGAVRLLAANGPADLITLRAARALAAADVLVVPAGADPHIVGMARRDAERMGADEATPERLAELARGGRMVVRLTTGGEDLKEALETAGASVEVLQTASS